MVARPVPAFILPGLDYRSPPPTPPPLSTKSSGLFPSPRQGGPALPHPFCTRSQCVSHCIKFEAGQLRQATRRTWRWCTYAKTGRNGGRKDMGGGEILLPRSLIRLMWTTWTPIVIKRGGRKCAVAFVQSRTITKQRRWWCGRPTWRGEAVGHGRETRSAARDACEMGTHRVPTRIDARRSEPQGYPRGARYQIGQPPARKQQHFLWPPHDAPCPRVVVCKSVRSSVRARLRAPPPVHYGLGFDIGFMVCKPISSATLPDSVEGRKTLSLGKPYELTFPHQLGKRRKSTTIGVVPFPHKRVFFFSRIRLSSNFQVKEEKHANRCCPKKKK